MSDYAAEIARRDAAELKRARDMQNATFQEHKKYNTKLEAAKKREAANRQ